MLIDEQDHYYDLPEGFVLEAGAKVRVDIVTGEDGATDLYMNSKAPIWNNNECGDPGG